MPIDAAKYQRITVDKAKTDIAWKLGNHVRLIEAQALGFNVRVLITEDSVPTPKKLACTTKTTRLTVYQADQQVSQVILQTVQVQVGSELV